MLNVLFWLACSGNGLESLPAAAVVARDKLAQELTTRDPKKVSAAAKHAAQWEGQDAQIDRLIGDALANVLMNPSDGLRLLQNNPDPNNVAWESALLAAASRTGDAQLMRSAWNQVGRPSLEFEHPVKDQVSQRMRANPSLGADEMEAAISACMLLDKQPPVGRQALDHPTSPALMSVAPAVGATQVLAARPIFRTDPDPQSSRGLYQCQKKVWLGDSWPDPMPRALTLAFSDGLRDLFVDIRLDGGEPWAYAASDAAAAGRWLEAMKLWETPGGPERVRSKFSGGLWVDGSEEKEK